VAFILAHSIAGMVLGFAVGAGGTRLGPGTRASIAATGFVLLLVGLAIEGLMGHPVKPQFNRETPFNWVDGSPYAWAWKTGAMLGAGLATRVAFWSFYLVPLVALVSGSPIVGATVWAAYSTTRGALAISKWPRISSHDGVAILRARRRTAETVDRVVLALGGAGIVALQILGMGRLIY
jgi:hypothetical protein